MRTLGLLELSTNLSASQTLRKCRATQKDKMKAFVRSIKKVGDAFVKAYLMSLMITLNSDSQNKPRDRY
jgi:hypothetical protein